MPTVSEDRDAIRDLYARYGHAIDSGAAEQWADLFTGDAEFGTGLGDPLAGREGLVAFAASLPPGSLHHMTTDLAIDVDGDRATVQSSVLVTSKGTVVVAGRSVDDLQRVDGQWRIARRMFTADAS